MVFPIAMDGCENWTIYLAEGQRIDAFELWCWRRLLRVPWTAKRSNQSILKKSVLNIHWKGWCWSWNSNTLATWCEELTYWKRSWCLGKIEHRRRRGQQRMRWLEGFTDWMASLTGWTWVSVGFGSWLWAVNPGMLQSVESQRVWYDWAVAHCLKPSGTATLVCIPERTRLFSGLPCNS